MPSTDAATGKFISAKEHYDLLIAEGNDPVLDPPELAAYMDGWDGEALMQALDLTPDCRVLEIGVGTGRLAIRVLKRGCGRFTGIDLSEPTIQAARGHLTSFPNATLLAGEFPGEAPDGPFDRIYSSLTFLHIAKKREACQKIASLLADGGRCVISLDQEQSDVLDMGSRKVRTYPDRPEEIERFLRQSGLCVRPAVKLERAYLIIADAHSKC